MIRLGSAILAAGMASSVLVGLSTGIAAATPECGDYHFIGAAGSGQRDGADLAKNGGMGGQVYQSYLQLANDLAANGQTITAEAVDYPALPVPLEGGVGGWLGFMGSVKDGTSATEAQYEAFTEKCPTTKVVLAGYSQGAMAIHRNLHDLADDPHLAGALLIADGDRLPGDTTLNMGSVTATTADKGMGVAQDHYILASAPTSPLPPAIGARTVSVCDVGDPVCDYTEATTMSPAELAIHTAYMPQPSGPRAWVDPLYSIVEAAPATGESTVEMSSAHGG